MLAIENDHSEVVKLFLRVKPDLAMMSNAVSGSLSLTSLRSLSYWMPILLFPLFFLQKGFTCAHIAAMKGSTAVIKELMKFNKSIVTSSRNRVRCRTVAVSAIKRSFVCVIAKRAYKTIQMCISNISQRHDFSTHTHAHTHKYSYELSQVHRPQWFR